MSMTNTAVRVLMLTCNSIVPFAEFPFLDSGFSTWVYG